VLEVDILHSLVKSLPRLRVNQHSRKQGQHLFVSLVLQVFSLSTRGRHGSDVDYV